VQALVCASSWIRGTYEDKNKPVVVWIHHSNMCHSLLCSTLVVLLKCYFFYFQVLVGDDEDDVEFIEFPNCIVGTGKQLVSIDILLCVYVSFCCVYLLIQSICYVYLLMTMDDSMNM
jgi:hypothetical protein